jgi:hypothetical protein
VLANQVHPSGRDGDALCRLAEGRGKSGARLFRERHPWHYDLANMAEKTFKETIKVTADQLVDCVKTLVHEGNVRRVVIKQDGRTVVEFPVTVGVVGTVFAPVLAAVGALAAILTECTIEVERAADSDKANVA